MPHCYRKLGEAGAAGSPPPTSALAEAVVKIDGVVAEQLLQVTAKQYNASSQGALQQARRRAGWLLMRHPRPCYTPFSMPRHPLTCHPPLAGTQPRRPAVRKADAGGRRR